MLEKLNSIHHGLSLHYSRILCKFCLAKKDGICDSLVDDRPCIYCYTFAEEVADDVIFKALTKGGDFVDINN